MISNTGETRFLFGTFVDVDSAPVFQGTVVYGAGFAYDAATNLPIAGTVERIEVQSRSTTKVLTSHATYPDINSAVADLNADFQGAHTPWFDASDFFAPNDLDNNTPLDLNVELDSAQMDELASGKTALHLTTGEFISANELSGIFAATSARVTPKRRAQRRKKARHNDPVALLNATYENAATSTFDDLDIEALENDLRVGAA